MGRVPYGTQSGANLVGDVFFQQLGIEGPMGRCVEDMAQLLAVQAGYDARAPLSAQAPFDFTQSLDADLTGKRVAWLGDMGGHLALEPALAQGMAQALGHFGTIGCAVDEAQLAISLPAVWECWLTLRALTVAGNLAPLISNPATRAQLKPESLWEHAQGQQFSAQDVYKASATRSALLAACLKLFETHDFIALPATQCLPFDTGLDWPKNIAGREMDTYHRWMECTIYATLAGLPAVCVPAGKVNGLPFGLQIIGKPQGEWALLQLAYARQQCTEWV